MRMKHLSGERFIKQAEQATVVSSFSWTTYLGATHQHAYLEYGRMPFIGKEPVTIICWTRVAELPTNIAVQLRSGANPWPQKVEQMSQPAR